MIYLIRHTTPLVEKGICYGQTDLDVTNSFEEEAAIIKNILPKDIEVVFTSPLQRCSKLAKTLFPHHSIVEEANLMELHCGNWEMQHWDHIPKEEIDPWMEDFVNVPIPNGESYVMLYNRIVATFEKIRTEKIDKKIALIAHGGVLRSILSYITETALVDSFGAFKINYGAVVLIEHIDHKLQHTFLSNIDHPKEQHKPSHY